MKGYYFALVDDRWEHKSGSADLLGEELAAGQQIGQHSLWYFRGSAYFTMTVTWKC